MTRNNADLHKGANTFEVGSTGMASPSSLTSFFAPYVRTPEALEKNEGAYQTNLQHHMKEHGFQGEVEIRKDKDGNNVIDDGHHRVAAALRLGIAAVPYRVLGTDENNKRDSICPTCYGSGHTWLTTSGAL